MTDHDPIEYALTETFTEREDWDEASHFALEALAVLRAERDEARTALEAIDLAERTRFANNYGPIEQLPENVSLVQRIARAVLASSEEGDDA